MIVNKKRFTKNITRKVSKKVSKKVMSGGAGQGGKSYFVRGVEIKPNLTEGKKTWTKNPNSVYKTFGSVGSAIDVGVSGRFMPNYNPTRTNSRALANMMVPGQKEVWMTRKLQINKAVPVPAKATRTELFLGNGTPALGTSAFKILRNKSGPVARPVAAATPIPLLETAVAAPESNEKNISQVAHLVLPKPVVTKRRVGLSSPSNKRTVRKKRVTPIKLVWNITANTPPGYMINNHGKPVNKKLKFYRFGL